MIRYVTSNASSGSGTLREAISLANAGDEIRFSTDVFERGTPIEIPISAYFAIDKNLTIIADPFRVVVDGQGSVQCARIRPGADVEFVGFDFIRGKTGSLGGGFLMESSALTLRRCRVCGCSAGGTLAQGGAICGTDATINLFDSAIYGNKYGGVACYGNVGNVVSVVRSTIAANVNYSGGYINVQRNAKTQITEVDSIIADDVSMSNFVAPPSFDYSIETWSSENWRTMNFHLRDNSTLVNAGTVPSSDILNDADAPENFDLEGNWRGRVVDGNLTRSPGAFETIQADLYWIGKDATGNDVENPSWNNASGWATNRFANVSDATIPPQTGNRVFVGSSVELSGDAPTGIVLVVGGGATTNATAGVETVGLSAKSATASDGFIQSTATSAILSSGAVVAKSFDNAFVSGSGSLTVAGGTIRVGSGFNGSLTVLAGSSVVLTAPPNNPTELLSLAVLPGAAIYGPGYATTQELTGTLPATARVAYGPILPGVGETTAFLATAISPTQVRLDWKTENVSPVVLERFDGDELGWTLLTPNATGGSFVAESLKSGVSAYRLWNGSAFFEDVAWTFFGVQFGVESKVVASNDVTPHHNWQVEVKLLQPTEKLRVGQAVTILARPFDELSQTNLYNDGTNIASVKYTCKTRRRGVLGPEYQNVPGHSNIEMGPECVLEGPQTSEAWPGVPIGFIMTPSTVDYPLFPEPGGYVIQVTISPTVGNPIVFAVEVDATE